MTAFLLATLYAPIASWGDITVGERRTSWDRPGRSAILGLVAAALGLTRDDQDGHDALDASLGIAVRVDAPGRVLVDFHTAQTLSQTEMKRSGARTRRAMIQHGEAGKSLETILSRRELRTDAAYTLALWLRADAPARWSLEALAAALDAPAFVLYAGRKANPLGARLDPTIEQADSLAEAFARRAPLTQSGLFEGLAPRRARPERARPAPASSVSSDIDPGIELGFEVLLHETRRDASPHRTRWQFANRAVATGTLSGTLADAAAAPVAAEGVAP